MFVPDSQRNSTCQTQSSWIRFVRNGRSRTSARVRYKNTLAYLFAGLRKQLYLSAEAVNHAEHTKNELPLFSMFYPYVPQTQLNCKRGSLSAHLTSTSVTSILIVLFVTNSLTKAWLYHHLLYLIACMVSQLSLCHPIDYLLRLSTACTLIIIS